LLYVAAVPLIAGILISLWAVGRSVLRPLAMVGGGAERLAGGDFAVRLPEFRGRELAAVSRAFNGMAMRLQRQASDLIGTVEQLRSDLEGLEEIQSLVTSGAGLGEVLSRAAHHLGSALGASGVGIWRKGEPEPRAVSGDRVPPAEAVRLAEGGAVHSSAGPLGAVDVNTAVNWLVAPATRRGTVLAVLGVVWDPPGPLAQAERDLVVSAAGVVGIAVENSDLLERLQEKEETLEGLLRTTLAAQEEERRRVAREIHDDSSQVLSALIMNIDLLQNQPACPEPFRVKLEAAKALAEEAARNLDKIMVDLRPALLDELGLAAALRWYVAQVREVWDVPVELLVEQARRLPEHVEVTAFRIAQEALGNAVRHSRARHVRVSIEAGERTAKVEVEDDGVGFDVPEAMSRARTGQTAGLVGMRERAELLGGSLRIESRPGEGTKVAAEIPFSAG
ncbi:MAG: ATP-binding protein, partial [Actinomycetota bacterium]